MAVLALLVMASISALQGHAQGTGTTKMYKWVFMVYLDADNNLESAGISDFNEMEMAGSTDEVAIVVLMDRIPGYDSSNGNWTDARIYLVERDADPEKINSKLLADLGEVDMGDPATLIYFVNYTVTHFPAEHYALVIWDHGNAWKRDPASTHVRGVAWDESSGEDYLTEQELIYALKEINSFTHIDLLGFDVCLLGMIEVAYDLAPYASVYVASQDYEPLDGWYYTPFLQALVANPNMTARELAIEIVKAYGYYYTNINPDELTTLAAIDLERMRANFTQAFEYASLYMLYNVFFQPDISEKIRNVRLQTETTGSGEYVDLYDFFERLSKADFWLTGSYDPRPLLNRTLAAYNDMLIASWAGPLHPNAHGFSIYMPPNVDSYLEWRYWYFEQTLFAQQSVWSWFLEYYFMAFKPSSTLTLRLAAPDYLESGHTGYALAIVEYAGKLVDPDSFSAKLVIPPGNLSITLDYKRIDTGTYIIEIPNSLNAPQAFIVIRAEYWILAASQSVAVRVGSIQAALEELRHRIDLQASMINASLVELRSLIEDEVNSLNATIKYLGEGIVEIKTSMGTIIGRITGVEEGLAKIQTSIGELSVNVSKMFNALNASISRVEGDIVYLNTSIGEVAVRLDDLNAEVKYLGNGLVEIKTVVGTINGKIAEITGDTAIIKTDLGDVKVKLDSISGDLSTVKELALTLNNNLAEQGSNLASGQQTIKSLIITAILLIIIVIIITILVGRKHVAGA